MLKTKRLDLVRPFWPEYSVKWLNDPEVVKYSDQRFIKHTVETQQAYLQRFDSINDLIWQIELNGFPIGNITANINWPHLRAEIGIMIGNKNEWGKGYGQEAWQAVMDFLKEKGIEKIEGGCHPLNVGMIKLFGKVGMPLEASIYDHFRDQATGIREPMFRFGKLL